jgi:hypothetical protein
MSRAPTPAAFKHAVKQGWSFKQHARQVCTAVGYLFGLLHSPTGGQEREVGDVQELAARVDGRRAREISAKVGVEICILDGGEVEKEQRFESDSGEPDGMRCRRMKGRYSDFPAWSLQQVKLWKGAPQVTKCLYSAENSPRKLKARGQKVLCSSNTMCLILRSDMPLGLIDCKIVYLPWLW